MVLHSYRNFSFNENDVFIVAFPTAPCLFSCYAVACTVSGKAFTCNLLHLICQKEFTGGPFCQVGGDGSDLMVLSDALAVQAFPFFFDE